MLEQVIMVTVLVAQEEADTSIRPWQTILRRIVSEAVTDGVDKAVQVRHPILSQQILIKLRFNGINHKYLMFKQLFTFLAKFGSRSVSRLSPPQSRRHLPRPI